MSYKFAKFQSKKKLEQDPGFDTSRSVVLFREKKNSKRYFLAPNRDFG